MQSFFLIELDHIPVRTSAFQSVRDRLTGGIEGSKP